MRRTIARLLAALALATMVAGPASGKDKTSFPVTFGGAFELVDHQGQIRRDSDFHGRFLLITFGYTHCPDICPTTLQSIAATLESLGPLARHLTAAFVSVDPDRDRPAALADYVKAFHPQLIGLTGSEAQIASVAKRYKLHRRKVIPADSTDNGDYLVDHGSLTFLIGPDGAFVTLFPFNTPTERMVSTVQKYLRKIDL